MDGPPTYEELLARVAELERERQSSAFGEQRLLALINSLSEEVWVSDAAGNVVLVNDAARSNLGVSRKEDLYRQLNEAVAMLEVFTADGSPRPLEQAPLSMALRGETVHGEEIVRHLRTGELRRRRFDAAPVIVDGRIVGAIALARDITAETQADEQLRRANQRLESLLENSPLAVIEWTSAEYRIVRWSKEATRIFGWTADEAVGRKIDELSWVYPEDLPLVQAAMAEMLEGKRLHNVNRNRNVRKDGSVIHCEWYNSILRGSSDTFSVLSLVLDVTSQKRAEEEQVRLLAELREADRRKNDFLGVLSHELRNPLTPIRNSLYLLERATPQGEPARRAHAVIDRQVGHLSRLIDDLLDVTRITRGKIRLQREHLDLVELVRRTVEDHRSMLARHELSVELPDEAVYVDGDPTRLIQALGNLLNNAVKFTPEGGRISVGLARSDGRAVLAVTDTGLGIDALTRQRLFEPFEQGDRSLDRSRGGLGLGLALVKGMIELHGGAVTAHSDGAGKGSRFTIELPIEHRHATPAEAQPVQQAGATRRRRILIIEDSRDAADSLSELLELQGHEVEVAYDGRSGLAKAHRMQPEVILCDIGLPGELDGYAVARALRQDPLAASAYLVALTGYAQPEDLQRARAEGFDAHLAKPPDLAALERLAQAPLEEWQTS